MVLDGRSTSRLPRRRPIDTTARARRRRRPRPTGGVDANNDVVPRPAWPDRRGHSLGRLPVSASRAPHRPPFGRSLSARLLLLAIVFVLLGEVLIFVPSIARFRLVYFEERIAAAHLATIGLGYEGDRPSPAIEDALLTHAEVLSITITRDEPVLMLGLEPPVDHIVGLAEQDWLELVVGAFNTLWQAGRQVVRVIGPSPMELGTSVEVTLVELPLYMAMVDYAKRIVALSLALSAIVAGMLFVALRWLIVDPLTRITGRLERFRRAPFDWSAETAPSGRLDEIGIVDRELDAMTQDVRQALTQKTRLAALGEAVGKLHHDLRNILGTALLISDRLERSADPNVQRTAPRLVQTLERAIRLCQETLDFARSRPPRPHLETVALSSLIDDVAAALPAAETRAQIVNAVEPGVQVIGDPDQLHRLFLNLAKNALEAMNGGGRLRFASRLGEEGVVVEVADTGPGLPASVRERLFEPFAASTSANGTGLGLAISREVARAHGGDLRLLATSDAGTTFAVVLRAARSRAAA